MRGGNDGAMQNIAKTLDTFFVKKAVFTQNTDSNENCYESLNVQNDVDRHRILKMMLKWGQKLLRTQIH